MQLTAVTAQTVAAGNNLIFDNPTCSCCRNNIIYQSGSGVVMVRGATNQCCAKYHVSFHGNAATPTGGTPGQISFAITLNGAPMNNAVGSTYTAAVEQYGNIGMETEIKVPAECCFSVAVRNIGTEDAAISNGNLIVKRIA